MFQARLILLAVFAMLQPAALNERPGLGVPLELAQDRAARISNLRYEIHVALPATLQDAVTGEVTLRFDLEDASRALALDYSGPVDGISAGRLNGREAKPEYHVDHLVVHPRDLREGPNEISLAFRSDDGPLNRTADFLYALFVPARARQSFPCFDQPDLKAKYTLSLDVPSAWEALANAPEVGRDVRGGRTGIRFAETKPIPTYLFTFAAGRFQVETAERNGRRFRMLHRETDAARVARNRDAIFDLHAGALSWLEDYTAIDYPFGKFDFLLVPSFQFGGMEHPGAVYYNASALLLDPSATQQQKLGRASLIAHETAHMWFGDLVTMRWFDDVWMKEVFANHMAAKIVKPAFPEVPHDLRFLYAHFPAAYDVDRTAGTNAIRQPLDNLNQAGSLYGAIIYQKAPIVMRQLELMLGESAFRDGMREYLRAHAYRTAAWPDLIAVLDRRTDTDLAAWSRAWVEERGRPTITMARKMERGITFIEFTQHDPYQARGLLWPQVLDVVVGYQRGIVMSDVKMQGQRARLPLKGPGSAMVRYVIPGVRAHAYGNFVFDEETRTYLLANLHALRSEWMRGAALVALWEEMVDGRVQPLDLLDALFRALPRETDELTVQRMLTYTQQAYWRWISHSQRRELAPRVESLLRAGLEAARTSSVKSAWFNAARDMALTAPTLEWLERVWSGQVEVAGLALAEPDFIQLAQELALRGVRNAQKILDTQIARTRNPDRKARMVFVRPALSTETGTRDRFFAQLSNPVTRRREPWVLEGLGFLHHPLRAHASEKHVRPALEMLREIQRTGDIFFPKRWMDATLSGHTSPAVAREVQAFLDGLPAGYPDRLRRIILSSADDLFRVTRRP